MAVEPATQVMLLLVEDNPGDADLVRELLERADPHHYQVTHVARLEDALAPLRSGRVDVILLDLSLPDRQGVESVRAVRENAGEVPIVVLTGSEDETLALACIDAGAEDFLRKSEIGAVALRRAVGHAVTRLREHQLQETLERYWAMSSEASPTSVTATLANAGPVRERHPAVFERVVGEYRHLLERYLETLVVRKAKPVGAMERVVSSLADVNGGPRDLLDVHLAALEHAVWDRASERARVAAVEGRLFALEMMGLLVDRYRVGHRWHQVEESRR